MRKALSGGWTFRSGRSGLGDPLLLFTEPMKITLRKFCTRTNGKQTTLANLEQGGKGEFVVCDGQVVVNTLPPTERADAMVVCEAVRDLVMRKRKQD